MKLKWWVKEPTYPVKTPVYGEMSIPPAVWRKLKQIEQAMLDEKLYRVHELQKSLIKSGFEAPTSVSEVATITKRLNDRQRHHEKGLR